MKRPRILLADDHRVVAEGFRKLLEPEFDFVGTAEDGRVLLSAVVELKPDVVLLDISMPHLNGIEAARELRKIAPDVKVVFLTMHANTDYVAEAFRAGASGYVLKHSSGEEVTRAVHEVLEGRSYITPLVTKDVVQTFLDTTTKSGGIEEDLTPRQQEVLRLVAEGRSIKEIASILDISAKTVEFHKSRIMKSIGLHTTAELTQYAIKHGLVSV
jgi:DNA-binding NarL/FixJ family response regulator